MARKSRKKPTVAAIGPAPVATGGVSPEATLRDGASGLPVTLADGQLWILSCDDLRPSLDSVRNRIFDANVLNGSYDPDDQIRIRIAAAHLVMMAHAIDMDTAVELIRLVPIETLIAPIEEIFWGDREGSRTYSVWARVSLRINGIDLDRLPPEEIYPTLNGLETTGKALPKAFIASVEAAHRRARRGSIPRRPAAPE